MPSTPTTSSSSTPRPSPQQSPRSSPHQTPRSSPRPSTRQIPPPKPSRQPTRSILKRASGESNKTSGPRVVRFPSSSEISQTIRLSDDYDRSPISVLPNICKIPNRGERIYTLDEPKNRSRGPQQNEFRGLRTLFKESHLPPPLIQDTSSCSSDESGDGLPPLRGFGRNPVFRRKPEVSPKVSHRQPRGYIVRPSLDYLPSYNPEDGVLGGF